MKSRGKEIIELFVQAFMDCIIVSAFLVIVICLITGYKERKSGELEFIFGYKPIYIVSGSMETAILKNSVVLLKEVNAEEVHEGDIITYRCGKGYVTHRLIGIDEAAFEAGASEYLITKGDNNRINDERLLNPSDIKGKVVWIFNLPGKISGIINKMKG